MPLGAQLAIAFLIGSGLGWVIGYLMARGKQTVAPANAALENELRQQLQQRDGELTQLRSEVVSIKTSLATAQANQGSAEKLLAEQRSLHDRTLVEAKESQAKALAELREAFKALSADALKQTAPEFLRLAEQSFGKFQEVAKGDLAQRQEAIKGLVEPLKQQLDTYQKRLQQSETTQADTLGKVKEQLTALAASSQSLAAETAQFRSVLKSNQARGRWGEETLRRVVEAAGMSAHCDFTEQAQSDDKKPDMIVKLPGNRIIIVDAKVPELDFLNALDSADTVKRAEALAAHAGKLKATIKSLAERDYPSQFPNALDHVVLFVPAESLFSAALEGDQELIVWAASKHIMLATPASLIALLRSVSMSWQQHAQTENAQKIAAAAQEFYARVVTFTEHFETIRDGLEKANLAYNKAASSFQSRVRPAGERLAELGGGQVNKALAEAPLIETQPQKLL
ncbi:MAG: DNA recombination protein RmuC [Verrucomicrobiota bacterium]